MALTNAQYDEIMRGYDKRQLQNKYIHDKRIEEAYRKAPRLREIDSEIASASVRQAYRLMDGDENALAALRLAIEDYKEERAALLSTLGYPLDYFEPIYTCPDCHDHRAAAALGTAHPDLAQRGHIGIVAHQHLDAVQQAGQLDGDVPLTPAAEVGADNGHDTAVQHRAGHTDTHALHLLGSDAVFLHLVLHSLGQVSKDVFTCIGGVGGHLPLFQQSARRGEQAHLGRGAAQVDAECVLFHIHLPLLCDGQAAGFLIVIIITYPFAKDSG